MSPLTECSGEHQASSLLRRAFLIARHARGKEVPKMAIAEIRMLGRFAIDYEGRSLSQKVAQKAAELLAYLLLHRTASHHRSRLATILWQQSTDSQAKSYLRKALWQLQSALPAPATLLLVDADWIQVQPGGVWLDVGEFEESYNTSIDVRSRDLSPEQVERLQRATALYRGELLEGWEQEWCLLERERFLRMNLIMLDKLVSYCLARRRFEEGIAYADQLLRWDPARERTHRHLMRLYAMANHRTDALRQFQRCATVLRQELGVEPAPRTLALYQAICENEPLVKSREASRTAEPTSPETQAYLRQVSQLLNHLQATVDSLQRQINRELRQ